MNRESFESDPNLLDSLDSTKLVLILLITVIVVVFVIVIIVLVLCHRRRTRTKTGIVSAESGCISFLL